MLFGIVSCSPKKIDSLPPQKTIVSEPTVQITPDVILVATKYPNSRMCETENYQGYFLTSFRREFGESPDKTWLFVQCLSDHEKHSHYVLLNQSDPSKSWAIEYPDIIENPLTWYAWSWAKDNQALYLGYRPFCEYAIMCMYVDAKGVFSLNPDTHEFSSLLPFREDKRQYSLSFTHDAKLLTYIITGTQTLYVRDLSKNEETEIALDTNQISYGNLSWSPDDNFLVFRGSSKENILDFSLWLFKSSDFSVTEILAGDEKDFFIAGWSDKGKILLHRSGVGASQPFRYTYDIRTDELLLLDDSTPSPTP